MDILHEGKQEPRLIVCFHSNRGNQHIVISVVLPPICFAFGSATHGKVIFISMHM